MHTLPQLNYNYADFAPHISERVMELHYTKHHQGYIDKLNSALNDTEYADTPLEELLKVQPSLPDSLATTVRNQGGGHYNHSLFWQWLSPNGGGQPSGELGSAIDDRYGDFQNFVDEFTGVSMSVFGSGWVWLMPDLSIQKTANQDSPLIMGEPSPILGNDIWEHAYYLDYENRRADYLAAWWNVVDWDRVSEMYLRNKNA